MGKKESGRRSEHPGRVNVLIVIAVLKNLPHTLKLTRMELRKSQRAVADECGLSFSTISRVEAGMAFDSTTAIKLLEWIKNQ